MINEHLKQELRYSSNMYCLPKDHVEYLKKLKEIGKVEPKVIYDIGSSLLHWTNEAEKIWSDSKIYLFDATDSLDFLYKERGFEYNIGVLSDNDHENVLFYQNDEFPGGNSYYKEDSYFTDIYYGKNNERIYKKNTLDKIVESKNFKYPDLIKIDVQGCELDVLKGATNVLKYCTHLIIELQHLQYNTGAPLSTESIPFIESLGFELITPLFCNNGPDGDYHFIKNKL